MTLKKRQCQLLSGHESYFLRVMETPGRVVSLAPNMVVFSSVLQD